MKEISQIRTKACSARGEPGDNRKRHGIYDAYLPKISSKRLIRKSHKALGREASRVVSILDDRTVNFHSLLCKITAYDTSIGSKVSLSNYFLRLCRSIKARVTHHAVYGQGLLTHLKTSYFCISR